MDRPVHGVAAGQFRKLVRLVAERGGDEIADGRPGWPWALRLADRVLPALAPVRKRRVDSVAIADGTLIPTRDHRLAAPSKNYRYSTNVQTDWQEELNAVHRTVRARVEHALARMKCWKILRGYRGSPVE